MSLHLVTGTDPLLRDEALDALVAELLGDDDRGLALEEFTLPGAGGGAAADESGDDADVGADRGEADAPAADSVLAAALNAAQTPPMMSSRRVVVVRDAFNLSSGDVEALRRYAGAPLPTSSLVLVAGGGAPRSSMPKKLQELVRELGAVVGPTSEKTGDVLDDELAAHGLRLSREARDLVRAHVGDDAGLVPALVATLQAVYPPTEIGVDGELRAEQVEPYLGEAGAVPVWDLTNAIEKGDVAGSLATAQRMLTVTSPRQPRPMHPLQVLGVLHGHYRRLLTLDDPHIRTNEEAADALGGRTKPAAAGYRLRQARALGTDGLRQAFDNLGRADLDLKGARAVPEDVVIEVLVARLAALSGRVAGRRR